jgi:hypothetical protein
MLGKIQLSFFLFIGRSLHSRCAQYGGTVPRRPFHARWSMIRLTLILVLLCQTLYYISVEICPTTCPSPHARVSLCFFSIEIWFGTVKQDEIWAKRDLTDDTHLNFFEIYNAMRRGALQQLRDALVCYKPTKRDAHVERPEGQLGT